MARFMKPRLTSMRMNYGKKGRTVRSLKRYTRAIYPDGPPRKRKSQGP